MTQQTVPQGPPANNGTQVVIEKKNEILKVFAFEGEKASAEAIAAYLQGDFDIVNEVGWDEEYGCLEVIGHQLVANSGYQAGDFDYALNNAPDVLGGIGEGTVVGRALAVAAAKAYADAGSVASLAVAAAKAVAIAEAYAKLDVTGMNGADIDVLMGHGDDNVYGKAFVEENTKAIALAFAKTYAQSSGDPELDFDLDGDIDAEYAKAEALALSADAGLYALAFATANAVAEAYVEAHTTAVGVDGGKYVLDNGADVFTAVAEGADCNIGVRDVIIDGGNGNDQFHLQSGTGKVIGGRGWDLLSLEGNKADYGFTIGGGVLTISDAIQNCALTNLMVKEVEQFIFADGSFTLAQLT